MGYKKCRCNLNNISGEASGINQTLCICSSSPQYIRHEVEKLSLCFIATAWRKRTKFSLHREILNRVSSISVSKGTPITVSLLHFHFLNTIYLSPIGITIVQLRFGSDQISKPCFSLNVVFKIDIYRCDQNDSCLNVMTKKHKYTWYIVFVINWKTVKRAACYFYPFNMLPWFKQKSHASSIRAQNFIKLRKHSFYGNLILIYMGVFIIWFLLSLLSLLLYSKCCDHSFLFGFSCFLETM